MAYDLAYAAAPFVGWLTAGVTKFAINSLVARRPAYGKVGLGGAVSTHTTIVATTAWLVGLREGFDVPAFGIALTLAAVVVIDALDLRQKIGRIASALKAVHPDDPLVAALRERMGHKPREVAAGVMLGLVCAVLLDLS